ncbi:MAG: hypothetical protein M1324_04180 [Patescibacteria group bacterium]|nr:hypothetical protein [Patescibacteria group bacterium]
MSERMMVGGGLEQEKGHENIFMDNLLKVPPAVVLEIRAKYEIGPEDSFTYKISTLTTRITLLEKELEIALRQASNSNDPEAFDDSEVYRAEILAAKMQQDSVIKEEKDSYIAQKRKTLLSDAGRKGAFTRQVNRLSKQMSECISQGDISSDRYIDISERFKLVRKNYDDSAGKLDRSKEIFDRSKSMSEEEVIFQKAIKDAFENKPEDSKLEEIVENHADTADKRRQFQEIKNDHGLSRKALKEIQNGGRISLFKKVSHRIKNKIDASPRLQNAVTVMKAAAIAVPALITAGSLFSDFILHDNVPEHHLSFDTTHSNSLDRQNLSKPSISNNQDNHAQVKTVHMPENQPVDTRKSIARSTDNQEKVLPYKVEIPPIKNEEAIAENSQIEINSDIDGSSKVDTVETPSLVVKESNLNEELIKMASDKAEEMDLPIETIEQITGPDFEKFKEIYEKKQVFLMPGQDIVRESIIDCLFKGL